MPQEIIETPLPIHSRDILDLEAVATVPTEWMILTRTGALLRFDAARGEAVESGIIAPPEERGHQPWAGHELRRRLHVSADGGFVALVNDYGTLGWIYDVKRSRITLELHGGEYYPNTVPFSFCFAEHHGQTVAVHRSDWNRLDISDAASGDLLTSRGPTRYRQGEPTPEHYLDYYHGRLLLSPSGNHIADDGWVWHPVGIVKSWEMRRWLENNVWESDDGSSKLTLCARNYYWDHAMCWLDDSRIAVGGIGEDDEDMIQGVRVFSVAEPTDWETEEFHGHGGKEVANFEGPAGLFFSDGERLFSTEDSGLVIWDVSTGSRADEVSGFVPTRQHPGGRELVEVRESVLRRWRY